MSTYIDPLRLRDFSDVPLGKGAFGIVFKGLLNTAGTWEQVSGGSSPVQLLKPLVHAHALSCARKHAHTHMHRHTCMRPRAHTHTHAHTHTLA